MRVQTKPLKKQCVSLRWQLMKSNADRLFKYSGYLYTRKARAKSESMNMTLLVQYFLLSKSSTLLFNRHTLSSKLRYFDIDSVFCKAERLNLFERAIISQEFRSHSSLFNRTIISQNVVRIAKTTFCSRAELQSGGDFGTKLFYQKTGSTLQSRLDYDRFNMCACQWQWCIKWYSINHKLYYAKRFRFLEVIFHVVKNAAILTSQILVSRWITLALYWNF